MKQIGIILLIIAFTAVIVMFPSLYYDNRDKALESYQNENEYKINTITDISLEKEIEILTDENSSYIELDYSMNSEDKRILSEMQEQLDAIAGVCLNDNIQRYADYNRVRVINSSAYNVYSVDLGVCEVYDETTQLNVYMVFDVNKRKILYLQLDAPSNEIFLFDKRVDDIMELVEKHYENYKNWECHVEGFFVRVYISGNEREMDEIMQKIRAQMEGDEIIS